MNRTLAFALVACAAAGSALADDITIDPNPFVSTRSRAEVLQELHAFRQSGVNPWADDYDQVAHTTSTMTRAQVQAAYLAERDAVAALTSEDSGSMYLTRVAASRQQDTGAELARAE